MPQLVELIVLVPLKLPQLGLKGCLVNISVSLKLSDLSLKGRYDGCLFVVVTVLHLMGIFVLPFQPIDGVFQILDFPLIGCSER